MGSRARPIYCIHLGAVELHSFAFYLPPQDGSVVTVNTRAAVGEATLLQSTVPVLQHFV